jgi:hypothetical protein
VGTPAPSQLVLLGEGWVYRRALFKGAHDPCQGSQRGLPYSAERGKKSVNRQALDELKQQIPLMGYLQAQDWSPARALSGGRWMGLCPLHDDHKPSFLVDTNKDLFHCYGCGRGGDVIRFAELYHQVKFPEALALLRQWRGVEHSLLHEAARFYRIQLHRHSEAVAYLYQRGVRSWATIERMRIGYAPGACLRSWLTQLGHSLPALRQAGLVTAVGYDAYVRRIVFPLEGNLYGRSVSAAAPPHRFLPGAKGGLYAWAQVRQYSEVIHRNPVAYNASSVRCFRFGVASSRAVTSSRLSTVGKGRRTFGLAISCATQFCLSVRVYKNFKAAVRCWNVDQASFLSSSRKS